MLQNDELIGKTFWTVSCQAYLEAFYKFCSNLGGTTADTMCPILEVSHGLKSTPTHTHRHTHTRSKRFAHVQTWGGVFSRKNLVRQSLPVFALNFLSLLQFEADRRAFIITINSFGTELSKEDRAKLFPHCGKLYPEGLAQLARADDYEQVKAVADFYPVSPAAFIMKHTMRWVGSCSSVSSGFYLLVHVMKRRLMFH